MSSGDCWMSIIGVIFKVELGDFLTPNNVFRLGTKEYLSGKSVPSQD
jgi:hypothetical protein